MDDFWQYVLIGIVTGSLYALVALGYTMVYGIIELINFAHGDLFMLGSFFALQTAVWLGVALAPGAVPQVAAEFVPPELAQAAFAIVIMLVAAPLFCAVLNILID